MTIDLIPIYVKHTLKLNGGDPTFAAELGKNLRCSSQQVANHLQGITAIPQKTVRTPFSTESKFVMSLTLVFGATSLTMN
jgi:hypothetical protein